MHTLVKEMFGNRFNTEEDWYRPGNSALLEESPIKDVTPAEVA